MNLVDKDFNEEFDERQQEVLRSVRGTRIILPILIGVGVVGYLFYRQYNPEDFSKIDWNTHTLLWVLASLALLIVRHLAYATRLHILSEQEFTMRKCIELIFIWEFSSAVSPTSVGGSAVALFVLAQEKLSTAKTTAIVLYTAVLDTIFFVSTLPIYLFLFGPSIIRPGLTSMESLGGWGYTFVGAYVFMAIYGSIFFYGLFINPNTVKNFLVGSTRIKFLKRYRANAEALGADFITASKEMKRKRWDFHIGAFLATATAWSCRFILLNFLIIAFTSALSTDFWPQFALFARLETMFVVIAFSPTPGGAGFAEIVFWGFLNDYIPQKGVALLVASIWRLFTYYFYLFAGAIIIPNWVNNLLRKRNQKRKAATTEVVD